MNQQSTVTQYRFMDSSVSTDRQLLCRSGENIRLGTKVYYLLLTFLENPGQVLAKDEIIGRVWPGQIVTDTALSKQILRLRKRLGDDDINHPMIETHRGIGFRFNPTVEVFRTDPQHPVTSNTTRPFHWKVAILTVLIALLFFITPPLFKSSQKESSLSQSTNFVSLAVIPSGNNPDWLNKGGLKYLTDLLSGHDQIHAITPDPDWYLSKSPEKLAITLSTENSIDYSCLIEISETNSGFAVELQMRTENGITSDSRLEASTLPALFEKIKHWIATNLSVRDDLNVTIQDPLATVDPYALQSYLHGLLEIESEGDEQKSLEYFQAAVSKDDTFLPAWIKLAEANMALGKQEKAISIADTFLNKVDFDANSKAGLDLNYIKANAYFRLRDESQAKQAIDLSEQAVANFSNPYKKLAGLKSLTLLARLQEDWKSAEQFTQQSLAISKEFYPLPKQLAELQLSLAKIYQSDLRFELMREYLELAFINYQKIDNANGMMASFELLNEQNFNEGRYDEGVRVAVRAEPYLDKNTAPHELVRFLQSTSLMLNLRGYFDRSEIYIKKIREVSQKTNNPYYAYLAEHIKLHLYYVQNQFDKALEQTQAIDAYFEGADILPSSRLFTYTVKSLVNARISPPELANQIVQEYIQRFPELEEKFSIEMDRAKGHIAVRRGDVRAGLKLLAATESSYRDKNQDHIANYIGFEILEILLLYPDLEYQETIDRLEQHTEYDYLFFKLKSQFKAREGNFFEATLLMQENKLRANQLWKAEDQLLMEEYQRRAEQSHN